MQKIVFLIRRKGYEIYCSKNKEPLIWVPSDKSYNNLEVLDHDLFEAEASTFFSKSPLPQSQLMFVFSDEVLFSTELDDVSAETSKTATPEEVAKAKENHLAQKQKFYDEVPINPPDVLKDESAQDGKHLYFAANRELFAVLKNFLQRENISHQVTGVFLAPVLGLDIPATPLETQASFGMEFINLIFGKVAHMRLHNLWLSDPEHQELQEEKKKFKVGDGRKAFVAGVFATICLVGLGLAMWFTLGSIFVKKPKPVPETALPADIAPIQTPVESVAPASPSGKINPDTLSGYTIRVLNGSGVAGQASAVKNVLSPLGFTQFTLGNGDAAELSTTTVVFTSRVPESVRQTVMARILDLFPTAISQIGLEEADFDIVVTTVK